MNIIGSATAAVATEGGRHPLFDRRRMLAAATEWAGRGSAALSEQALFAGGNFVLNISLAVTIPAAEYGAFVFAFTMFTIAAGFHNALILEPAIVLRTTLYDVQPRSYIRAQVILHGCVMVVLAGSLGLIGLFLSRTSANSPIGPPMIAAACASPFVLLHWMGRRFLYALRRPATALGGSAVYLSAIAVLTLIARANHGLSPVLGFAILGSASAVAALFLLARAGVFTPDTCPDPPGLLELALERWSYGRWLIGSVCIESAIVPGLTMLTTAMVGLSAVGILRAMQIFVVPAAHTVTAISTLVLPTLARDYQHGRFAALRDTTRRVLFVIVAGAVLFELALALLHIPLEHLVYGRKFAQFAFLIPIVGGAALLDGTAAAYSMLLSAVQRPRLQLISVAATVPVTLISGVVLISAWGITGAALASVMTAIASLTVRRRLAQPWLRVPVPAAVS